MFVMYIKDVRYDYSLNINELYVLFRGPFLLLCWFLETSQVRVLLTH